MNSLKNVVALIPARGGSKGVPRKNITNLHGKPLIAWTIEEAKKCPALGRIIVSTEDDEIAEIAASFGADVPFSRPPELAQDTSSGIDVILHAVDWLSANAVPCDVIVLLQPTSPLRLAKDIDGALEQFSAKQAGAVVSVCPVDHPPYWANTLPGDMRMNNFLNKELMNKNRQDLPPYYRLNGSIYIAKTDLLKTEKSFFGERSYAYIMPAERSIDIDNTIDFELCRVLLEKYPR